MIWATIATKLLGTAAPKVADYFLEKQQQKHQRAQEIEQHKHELKIEQLKGKAAWEAAKTKRAEASEGRDHEWEMQSLLIHTKGWKDEAVYIVLSIPAVLSFIPYTQPWVMEGFKALETTPLWYQILLTMVYAAIFGIRTYRRGAVGKNLMKEVNDAKD